MGRAIRLITLPSDQKRLMIRTLAWIIFFRICLWVLPYSRIKSWMRDEHLTIVPGQSPKEPSVEAIVNAVRACRRYVPYASCLTQAIAAKTMLRRAGYPSTIKIGVVKHDGDFLAHAWLEIDGKIVLGKQRFHSRYSVLGDISSVRI